MLSTRDLSLLLVLLIAEFAMKPEAILLVNRSSKVTISTDSFFNKKKLWRSSINLSTSKVCNVFSDLRLKGYPTTILLASSSFANFSISANSLLSLVIAPLSKENVCDSSDTAKPTRFEPKSIAITFLITVKFN